MTNWSASLTINEEAIQINNLVLFERPSVLDKEDIDLIFQHCSFKSESTVYMHPESDIYKAYQGIFLKFAGIIPGLKDVMNYNTNWGNYTIKRSELIPKDCLLIDDTLVILSHLHSGYEFIRDVSPGLINKKLLDR